MNSNRFALAALACGLLAFGCERYARKPLDLEAHRAAWIARDPAGADMLGFARRLAHDITAPATYDPVDGISLAEAEAIALVFNPELRLARANVDVASANVDHAGRWEDPVLSVDALRIIESVPDPWILGTSLGFTLPLSGRLAVEKDLAAAEQQAAVAKAASAEWDVIAALRAHWIEWSSLQIQAEVITELADRLRGIVDIVDRLEQVGEISRVESRLFKVEAARRANESRVLEGRLLLMETEIKALLGLRPEADIALAPALAPPLIADSSEELLAHMNPSLAIARAEYEVAEQALHREIRKQYPDVALGPAYENEEDQSRIGLAGSLPLPLLNRNRAGIAEARAQRERSRVAFEARYEALVHEWTKAQLELEFRRQVIQNIESIIIPLVEDQVRDAQRMIELGEINTLLQLESLVGQAEAKLKLVEARQAEALAVNRLAALFGPARFQARINQGDQP